MRDDVTLYGTDYRRGVNPVVVLQFPLFACLIPVKSCDFASFPAL
jgi:hypothetical protein